MIPFSVSYLAVFALRAELPAIGRLVSVAIALAALLAVGMRRPRVEKSAVIACVVGALVALVQAPAREQERRPAAATLDAHGMVARVQGTVEAGGRVDVRGSWFKLAGGPEVRVAGGRSTPPPHATVAVAGRLDAARGVIAAASPEAVSLVAPAPALSWAGFFESLRQACRDRIGAACPPETARVLLPLLIGDGGLPEDFREDLARTGTLHIVAVSGTHLSLFLAGLRIFTRRLRLLVPMLVLYAGLCAFDPPVLRSLVLAIGFLCGRRVGRALPQGAHFLFSAVVVLCFDPAAFFDAGFQLSFSAFGGIIAIGTSPEGPDPFAHARERSAWKRAAAWLGPAARAGGGATLATAPAMIWRFNRISPVGVPATLILSPFVPVLLWLGALIVIFPENPAFPRLATALIDLLLLLSAAISAMPLASVDVAQPHSIALAAFAGVVCAIALSRTKRWSAVRIAAVFLSSLLVLVPDAAPPGLYQLQAGRGSATLLIGRAKCALVDVGPPASRVPEQVLKLGVRRVDLLVLTHGHADHVGGLDQALARLAVKRVVAGPSCEAIRETAGGREVGIWERGAVYDEGGLRLEALWPPRDVTASENDRSLVILAAAEGRRALLCGDVESSGLVTFLRTTTLPTLHVLLVPHHGSANDGLCDLLLRTRPAVALIPARAGFPAEETLLVLAALGVRTRATYLEGTIAVPFGHDRVQIP